MTQRKRRAVVASFWVASSIVFSYGTRLVSNLVLTRLLFPEVFGLLAFVTIVMNVLSMFSDFGVGISVLRSKRGDERYINCAWTVRLIRGGAIWIGASIAAWPASWFFEEPQLIAIIPAVALASAIGPLSSPSLWICNRKLVKWPLFWRSAFNDTAGLLLKIILAIYLQSVWALVIGQLFACVLGVVTSYWVMPGIRPRLVWDREIVREFTRFGKWLFASSILAFVVQQGDKIVLGKQLDTVTLGIYVIALILPNTLVNLVKQLDRNILLPVYADLAHHATSSLRRRVMHSRIVLVALTAGPACVLAVGGQFIIELLYDPRYVSAGWILQIIATGVVAFVINTSMASIALPVGDSRGLFVYQLVKGVLFLAGMVIGGWLFGFPGLIAGIAISHFLSYPAAAWIANRHGVWHPLVDGAAYLGSIVVISLGWYLIGPPEMPI